MLGFDWFLHQGGMASTGAGDIIFLFTDISPFSNNINPFFKDITLLGNQGDISEISTGFAAV